MLSIETFKVYPFFEDVQLQQVFPDGKLFVDYIPKTALESINHEYLQQKNAPGFNLMAFINKNFDAPSPTDTNGYVSDKEQTLTEHINELWPVLTRQPDTVSGSLIPLPNPYVVPGGRFREVYYWDSYFTMLGLEVSGRVDLVEDMLDNFSFLIDSIGYIPNGNRTYYIGRSQPPFYSLMVDLLIKMKGEQVLLKYLPRLEKEYQFWMGGQDELSVDQVAIRQVVRLPDGEFLNRYWDENDTPRPEAYREDIELSKHSQQVPAQLFRHLRAGAASGWDYSLRWFRDGASFESIHTADIVPVDLNALLYHLEKLLEDGFTLNGEIKKAELFRSLAEKRAAAIQKYCWDDEEKFYFDFDLSANCRKKLKTLAAAYPLFFRISTDQQAKNVADTLENEFVCDGGLVTTLENTGQQWDAPNGWAPLQWMAIMGLENYRHHTLAKKIACRWIQLNNDVFHRTGKLMEKYNVVDTHLEAGGGEYPGQDGFGWTNGVLLAMLQKYGQE